MSFIKRYIRIHISALRILYHKILSHTDKNVFVFLFNLRSWLYQNGSSVSWDGSNFVISDKTITDFSYKFRYSSYGSLVYEWGVRRRAERIADDYFLKKIDFKSGDVLYDCGANVGDLKLWFLFNNIDVTYVGFEPSPVEFNCLKDNVYPSKVHNVGLWNEEGELKFYVSSQLADSSLIMPKEYNEVITSKVVRLEKFIKGNIKCLKLEAEGAEPEILEGIGCEKLECIEYIAADLGFERGVD
jgi:FkbM family methyltransferase